MNALLSTMYSQEYILAVAYVMAGLLGLCVGSFLNVVIYRVPNEMSLATPSSHCPKCGYMLRWYDNIPVFSYLFLGGKCRKCRQPISIRYTLVELANMALWIACVALFWEQSVVYACVAAILCSTLICIFFIDLEHMLIFNRFTITVAVLGLVAMFFDGYTSEWDHVIGAIAGGLVFVGIYYGGILALKKEGLGWGDVKLAAAAGLFLGWQKLILAMLIASVGACIVLLALRVIRKDEEGTEYPFGPFIVTGMLIAALVGTPILNWYIGLFFL